MKNRVSYESQIDRLRISIRPPPSLFTVLFLVVFWLFWTGSVISTFRTLLTGGDPFLVVWLVLAVPVSLVVPVLGLWLLFGYEEIVVSRRTLTLALKLLRWRLTKVVSTNEVNDLRAAGAFFNSSPRAFRKWLWGFGTVAFDLRREAIRFGANLDEQQAREIVARIQPYLPAAE